MGLGHRKLYATNTGDESGKIFLSAWKPIKKEGGYCMPPNTPLGGDIWVPNSLDLKEEEGTVPVMVVKSEEDTGTWLICADEYFGGEEHLFNYKPKFRDDNPKRIDWEYADSLIEDDNMFGIHIITDIGMKSGELTNVKLVRGEYPERKPRPGNIKKKSLWKRLLGWIGL